MEARVCKAQCPATTIPSPQRQPLAAPNHVAEPALKEREVAPMQKTRAESELFRGRYSLRVDMTLQSVVHVHVITENDYTNNVYAPGYVSVDVGAVGAGGAACPYAAQGAATGGGGGKPPGAWPYPGAAKPGGI